MVEITKSYINEQKKFYELKLNGANTVREMKNAYWWLNFLDNFNWIKG